MGGKVQKGREKKNKKKERKGRQKVQNEEDDRKVRNRRQQSTKMTTEKYEQDNIRGRRKSTNRTYYENMLRPVDSMCSLAADRVLWRRLAIARLQLNE